MTHAEQVAARYAAKREIIDRMADAIAHGATCPVTGWYRDDLKHYVPLDASDLRLCWEAAQREAAEVRDKPKRNGRARKEKA